MGRETVRVQRGGWRGDLISARGWGGRLLVLGDGWGGRLLECQGMERGAY